MPFRRFVQNIKTSFFSNSFDQKTTKQSDGSSNVTSETQIFYKKFKKQSFYFCNHLQIYIGSGEYCIASHDEKLCFLNNCRYHIILMRDIKDLLQKLHALCCDYQYVECLCTLSSTDPMVKFFTKTGQFFDIIQRAVQFKFEIGE